MTTSKPAKDAPAAAPGVISGTVDARAFTARLKLLCRLREADRVIPILSCCRITFEPMGFRMKLSHHGIDMELSTTLPAEGAGDIAVPMKTLLTFIAAANGTTLSIEKKAEDSAVTFTCGRFSMRLVPLPTGDIPSLNVPMVFDRAFTLGEGVMAHLLALSLPYISTEETRYYLNGVLFEIAENDVRAVATDGHRLGTRSTTTPAPLEAWEAKCIVPRFACAALAVAIGKAECTSRFHAIFLPEKVEDYIAHDGPRTRTIAASWQYKVAQFSSSDWTITTKLIDGTFPNWRRVIPAPDPDDKKVAINSKDLIRFATMRKGGDGVGVRVEHESVDSIKLSTGHEKWSPDVVFDASAEAKAPEGGFPSFGVNAKYLASVARSFGSDWINLIVHDSASPFVMRGEGAPDSEYVVLMPMRV